MTRLLDINVLLALAWPQHVHHARANRWVVSEKAKGKLSIATCPLTELGFLRVSMNLKAFAADFQSASGLLNLLTGRADLEHLFWADDLPVLSLGREARPRLGPNQLTDVYLANLADYHQGVLATFDRRIGSRSVEFIP
jgi:uncharacterized protein